MNDPQARPLDETPVRSDNGHDIPREWMDALEDISADLETKVGYLYASAKPTRHFANPFHNSGGQFECPTFTVEAYAWGDEGQPWNFRWEDVRIRWYKWLGFSTPASGSPLDPARAAAMREACLAAIADYVRAHEGKREGQVVSGSQFEHYAELGRERHGPWGTRGAAVAALWIAKGRAAARAAGLTAPDEPIDAYAARLAETAGLLRQAAAAMRLSSSPRATRIVERIDALEDGMMELADEVLAHHNRWLPHKPDFDLDRLAELSLDPEER